MSVSSTIDLLVSCVLSAGIGLMMVEEIRSAEFSVYRELGDNWRPGDPIREIVCADDVLIASTIGGNTDLDKALTVFNRHTGRIQLPRLVHASMPNRMRISGDRRQLVSCANDGATRFWSLESLQHEPHTEVHFDDAVESVAMQDDQRFGCILVGRNVIEGWDFSRLRRRYRISHLTGRVSDIACSFERDLLVAVMPPNEIAVFIASSGQPLATHRFSDLLAMTCCIAPDGDHLLLVGADPSEKSILFEVKLIDGGWNILELSRLDCHTCAAFSPAGDVLASGGADPKEILLVDTSSWQQVAVLTGHTDRVRTIAFSPEGDCLYSGGNDGIVRCWRVHPLQRDPGDVGPQHRVTAVRFSPRDSEDLAVVTGDGTVSFWQVRDAPAVQRRETFGTSVQAFAWAPDGLHWAAGLRKLTHAGNASDSHVLNNGATAIDFGDAGRRLFTVSDDLTVRFWNIDQATENEIRIPAQPEERLCSVASLPSHGTMCLVATDRGRVIVVDVAEKSVLRCIALRSSAISRLASSGDGSVVYCSSRDGSITVLDSVNWSVKRYITAHSSWINDLAVSFDGRYLASASHDSTVAVWDASSLTEIARLRGHSGVVRSVSFSPDGRFLASGGDDATVIIWSMTRDVN